MRKYQPIWEELKQNFTASIRADKAAHSRIIKAVRKEKDNDTPWKLLMSEEGKRYKLYESITGNIISFRLEDVSPITVEDL